jgi:DNA invertase Pin-like site-specific DNA recombinase
MAKVGYRRVSTLDQNLDRQELEGCDKVFEEKVSGSSRDRQALTDMLAWVREGDEVIVWSIDRLARDLRDLEAIISELNEKGVSMSFVAERLSFSADKDDPISRLQLQLMGAFAQFERSIILKRQREGIEKAKARGVYKGRKPKIDYHQVAEMRKKGYGAHTIATTLGISRASVYRVASSAVSRMGEACASYKAGCENSKG